MEPEQKRGPGRPRMPEATVINLRIQKALLDRLDRYIDSEKRWSHDSDINRATVHREALEAFLSSKGY